MGSQLAEQRISPVAAFCVQMVRGLTNVAHPSDGPDPASEEFDLEVKPRGIYDQSYFHQFDEKTAQGVSPVISGFVKKDGQLGRKQNTDFADPAEISALLDHLRRRIGQIGDAIMSGDVRIEPYRKSAATACQQCSFQSVCRFETHINRYRNVQSMNRLDVLQRVVREQDGARQ